MSEKQKARSWKEVQTMIAAISMMTLFGICNVIASFERHELKREADQASLPPATPSPTMVLEDPQVLPAPTQAVTSTGSS